MAETRLVYCKNTACRNAWPATSGLPTICPFCNCVAGWTKDPPGQPGSEPGIPWNLTRDDRHFLSVQRIHPDQVFDSKPKA